MPAPDSELTVGVVGAAGYVGGELLRLLATHPRVAHLRAVSRSGAGRPLGALHPALAHLPLGAQRCEEGPVEALAAEADVLFLALPHGASQRLVPRILAQREPPLLVDLAADFRLTDLARHERFYGPHAAPELAGSFVYGLADALGPQLAGARRIAVPGCFATATLLALRPFAAAGLIAEQPVAIAMTGSTGSGAVPKPTTHHPRRAHNLFAYAASGHRHEAEIAEELQRAAASPALSCTLLPHSAPLVRGLHVTISLRPRAACHDPLAVLRAAWEGRPFVHVLDAPPELSSVAGTNHAHLHAVARDEGREVVLFSAIDNLVKGAAGQALQAMNLALGIDETAGLRFPGLAPC